VLRPHNLEPTAARLGESALTPFKIIINRQLFFLKQRTFSSISFFLLDNKISGKARAALLSGMGAKIGKNCFLRGGLTILETFDLTLGDRVFINNNCTIDCSAPVTICDGVCIGYNVTLSTGNHVLGGPTKRCGIGIAKPITVKEGAWIGAGSIIFSGVTLGEGSVVMGGSVVGADVAPNTMVGGNPARPIKKLDIV
jgi:acetyltransferase-like isoleucine patch superfamily enzyme